MDQHHTVIGGLWLFRELGAKFFGVRGPDGAVHHWRFFLKTSVQRRFETGPFAIGFVPKERWNDLPVDPAQLVEVVGSLEATPDGRSRILLADDEFDEIGDPLTLIDYFIGAADQDMTWRCAQLFAREAGVQGLGRMELTLPRPGSDAVRSVFLGGRHSHMGTVRMGESPRDAVVDGNLKVFGIDNLFLATCGVFPTSSCVDPTMNGIAFSFRLADHLSRKI